MTNNANPQIPAQRYFTLEEMCRAIGISPEQFERWQHENGVVIGYGGERYTRADVMQLLKLKDTFAPYDELPEKLDADGNPAATTEEIREGLQAVLADLEKSLTV